jgi:hypothetical protein
MVTLKEFSRVSVMTVGSVCDETYPTDDLMDMRRRIRAWIDQGIETLDGELCASEAQETSTSWCEKPGGSDDVVPLHFNNWVWYSR